MARVVVFGLGPMRWEHSTRLFALPLRTWHVAAALARDGHDVMLFSMRTAAFEGWPADKATRVVRDGVTVYSLSEHLLHDRRQWVEEKIRSFGADCIVGVNRDPASLAAELAGALPFWADINGDPMAEAQAKAEAVGSDTWTPEFHRRFVSVLTRADVFSTCSEAQRMALIGQLSMLGRLTAANAGYEFVHAIPNSVDEDELRLLSSIRRRPRQPEEPFVLLWSGSYNTWCDLDVLFEGIDQAMRRSPALRFVSTSGGIEGHYTEGYDRFRTRAARSEHAARYHFAGWVETAELPAYYRDAHAAILTDRYGYEGLLGARTRMIDWAAAGLPIVTTRLSEISRALEDAGAALASPCGDVDSLVENILTLVNEPHLALETGERARRYARESLRASTQFDGLRAWVRSPRRAPDGDRRVPLSHPSAPGGVSLVRQWLARTREAGLRVSMSEVRRFTARRLRQEVQRALGAAGGSRSLEVFDADVTPQVDCRRPK